MSAIRIRLYHDDFPSGAIFTDSAAYEKAKKLNWQEAPWLVNVAKEDIPNPNKCACGCGTEVDGTWVKGHHFRGKKDGDKENHKSTGQEHPE